jgi:ankyrin repeat protein
MHRLGIGIVATVLLIALSILCSASFAEDQSEELIEAACKGDLRQVQELLDKGADINAKDRHGMTALMWVSYNDNAEIVRVLLAKGADIVIVHHEA